MPGKRRPRGSGAVYEDRTAGVWVASLSLGIRGGRRRRVRRTAPDRRAAERKLDLLKRWYGMGGEVAFLTLEEYLETWLDAIRPTVAPRSHEAYRNHVTTHITPLLGGILVGALRPADVRRLIADRLAHGKSAQTVVSVVSTLRHALAMAERDGELARNVASLVELPRVDREPVEAMTAERAQAILAAVRGDRLDGLYVLLLGTGLRVGEALALDWRDVDLGDAKSPPPGGAGSEADPASTSTLPDRYARIAGQSSASVTVRRGKTRQARRTVPLPGFVAVALRAHRGRQRRVGPGEPVFTGERTGERLTASSALGIFQRLVQRAGLPPMRLHDLRHGTATLLLAEGVEMRIISEVLGHASPAFTSRLYAHVTERTKRAAMASLDRMGGTGG